MDLTYKQATPSDVDHIYKLCVQLIEKYEDLESIDFPKVIKWVREKIEQAISQYTVIYKQGQKAGYYRFYLNDDGNYEIDDLYIFPEFQNQGIGSEIMNKCCASVSAPVMLYVFIANERAVALYKRLGFKVAKTIHCSRYIMINDHRQKEASMLP
jgi:ribosomal protein S18 acetylase RimI-like enzyme